MNKKNIIFVTYSKRNIEVLKDPINRVVDINKIVGFYCMLIEIIFQKIENINVIFMPMEDEDKDVLEFTIKNLEKHENFSWKFFDFGNEEIYRKSSIIITDNLELGKVLISEINNQIYIYLPFLELHQISKSNLPIENDIFLLIAKLKDTLNV